MSNNIVYAPLTAATTALRCIPFLTNLPVLLISIRLLYQDLLKMKITKARTFDNLRKIMTLPVALRACNCILQTLSVIDASIHLSPWNNNDDFSYQSEVTGYIAGLIILLMALQISLVNVRILKCFRIITSLKKQFLQGIRNALILVYIVLALPASLGGILSLSRFQADWYVYFSDGILLPMAGVFTCIAVLYDNIQGVYLVYKIMAVNKNRTMKEDQMVMKAFKIAALIIIALIAIDWSGLILFALYTFWAERNWYSYLFYLFEIWVIGLHSIVILNLATNLSQMIHTSNDLSLDTAEMNRTDS